jgi:hypothetical protein
MRLAGSPGMAREVRLEKNGDSIHGLRAEYFAATNAFDQALALPPVTSFLAQGLAYRSLRYFYLLQLEDALSTCNRTAWRLRRTSRRFAARTACIRR